MERFYLRIAFLRDGKVTNLHTIKKDGKEVKFCGLSYLHKCGLPAEQIFLIEESPHEYFYVTPNAYPYVTEITRNEYEHELCFMADSNKQLTAITNGLCLVELSGATGIEMQYYPCKQSEDAVSASFISMDTFRELNITHLNRAIQHYMLEYLEAEYKDLISRYNESLIDQDTSIRYIKWYLIRVQCDHNAVVEIVQQSYVEGNDILHKSSNRSKDIYIYIGDAKQLIHKLGLYSIYDIITK